MADVVPVLVVWSSQTGASAEIAKLLYESLVEVGLSAELVCMEDVVKGKEGKHVWLHAVPLNGTACAAAFVTSSTGDGESPENGIRFMRWLRRASKESDALAGLQYVLLGLGDTNYDTFQGNPRTLDGMLKAAGARELEPRAEADEATGLEEVVEPWLARVPQLLRECVEKMKESAENTKQSSEVASANAVEKDVPLLEAIEATVPEAADDSEAMNGGSVAPGSEECGVASGDSEEKEKSGGGDAKTAAPKGDRRKRVGARTGAKRKGPRGPRLPPVQFSVTRCDEAAAQQYRKHRAEQIAQTGWFGHLAEGDEALRVCSLTGARWLTTELATQHTLEHLENVRERCLTHATAMYCANPRAVVDPLLSRLGVNGDDVITVEPLQGSSAQALPRKSTAAELLSMHADVTTVGWKKTFLRMLAEYTSDEDEKSHLLHLCSSAGSNEYRSVFLGLQPSLLDVLCKYPSCNPPFAHLISCLPPLQPRYYSLVHSPAINQTHLTVALTIVEEERAPLSSDGTPRVHRGLCSTFLSYCSHTLFGLDNRPGVGEECLPPSFHVSPQLVIRYRQSAVFRAPDNCSRPMILVGAGTGIAPFVGFLEERRRQVRDGAKERGETIVFFGCRHREQDWIYRDELLAHCSLQEGSAGEEGRGNGSGGGSDASCRMMMAFSREGTEKVYVQHRMEDNGAKLMELMNAHNAVLFVCGDSDATGVVAGVTKTLARLLQSHLALEDTVSHDTVKQWRADGRLVFDVWR